MKYKIITSLTLFVFIFSCKKEIRYGPKGETIYAATLHGDSDTGKVWIVDSIKFKYYSNWDPNYHRPGLGNWRNVILLRFITSTQFIRFKNDFTYSTTDSVSKYLGILASGNYNIAYSGGLGDFNPEDSSTISMLFSCVHCSSAIASRTKSGESLIEDKIQIEAKYYEPNPYDGIYYGTAFIRPL